MYQIFADKTLIYDSTLEDYKIGKGSITLETNKSGSFTFSLYPDHFYYDSFIRLKTVITVYKSGRIVFRGRILNDTTDYWNNKVFTCEGELGFLQDSIIRPFSFYGTPQSLFSKLITEHNSQVDEFKRFKIGRVTISGSSYISRANTAYESALTNLNGRLIDDTLGGYFYITHGDDGKDEIPTINYLADFTNVATQTIEFGLNLKNYTKTVKADDIATAIIPLGATVDDGNSDTEDPKLTIASVNKGVDYVYSASGVALYGWIFKSVAWDDVTDAATLKSKAEAYLNSIVQQNITIELTAIDLHLLDKSIESFHVCDYIRVISEPHNFDSTLLCNKQTIDLLKPENDSLTLGHTYSTFTEKTSKVNSSISTIIKVGNNISALNAAITNLGQSTSTSFESLSTEISTLNDNVAWLAGHSLILPNPVAFAGYLTGSGKDLNFTIPVGKPIRAGGVSVEGLIIVRGSNGYITEATYSNPLDLADADYTITASIISADAGLIHVTVSAVSAFGNITNNTTLTVIPSSELTITFTD